ncbi:Protein of unknown function [Escherichia coli D6-113.11]|nr:Protein of unknown function [Escherichia coli D6-113.11]CDU36110.1 Protein of unknown function [Escherichia coli D6-113.11]
MKFFEELGTLGL